MVNLSDDNKQLFGEQVNDHIEKLNELMEMATGSSIATDAFGRASLATKLLEGSTGMLGFEDWSRTLSMLRERFDHSAAAGQGWGELLSQVVSEVLEVEEQLAAQIMNNDGELLDGNAGFDGLQAEINVLMSEAKEGYFKQPPERKQVIITDPENLEEAEEITPTGARIDTPQDVGATAGTEFPEEVIDIASGPDIGADEKNGTCRSSSTVDRLIMSLERIRDRFGCYLENTDNREELLGELEIIFGESEFYLGLIGNILTRLGGGRSPFKSKVRSCTLVDGVQDFFSLHGKLRGWKTRLETHTDDFAIEREAGSTLAYILESCLYDIGTMYEGKEEFELEARIDIKNEGTYFSASISDNGPDFLCDSEIDRDDAVAFYKGLLGVRNRLESCDGLLWVEPDGGKSGRFKFTMPHTREVTDYLILTSFGDHVAVPKCCVERIVSLDEVEVTQDSEERYFMTSGTRIPVYGLHELAAEEVDLEGESDHIFIIGLAEKRVGVLAKGEGRQVQGVADQLTNGSWASLTRNHLHLGEEEYPVLDAKFVIDKVGYLQRLGDAIEETGSFVGGVGTEEEVDEITVPRV